MNSRYSGGSYTVEQLLAITKQDTPDVLEKQSEAWGEAARMCQLEMQKLQEHYDAIKDKWTGRAGELYMETVRDTITMIEGTRDAAEQKAEATGSIASSVRWQQQKVQEEYDAWQEAKSAADEKSLGGALWDTVTSIGRPSDTIGGAWDMYDSTRSDDERRRPYDEKAREHMDIALDNYDTQRPAILQPLPVYKPLENPGPAIGDDHWLGGDDWGPSGAGGSNAADTAGLSAASYGGNATGPALQNAAGAAPAPPQAGPAGGAPAGPSMGAGPVGGIPAGGVSSVGRTPTPPAKPLAPNTNRAPGTRPPGTGAQRTPSLPGNNRGNANVSRPGGGAGRGGANAARPGAGGRNVPGANGRGGAGRGLQKSQYAPQDRTGRVRASGEVMGRRASTAKQQAEAAKNQPKGPQRRAVSRPVVSGSKTSRPTGKDSSLRGPKDRTGQGYTKQVIGQRNTQFSRTPVVGRKLDPTAGQHILGKKIVETEESRKQKMLNDRMARRRKIQESDDGLSRPVIDNGITNSAQLENAEPSKEETVKAEDSFWQLDDQQVTRGVIGQPRPMPEATHDPGPGVITGRGAAEPVEEEPSRGYDPGPTAFGRQRPDTTNWP